MIFSHRRREWDSSLLIFTEVCNEFQRVPSLNGDRLLVSNALGSGFRRGEFFRGEQTSRGTYEAVMEDIGVSCLVVD